MIFAWTDYPITRMGDAEGKEAPIRPCKVVSYDGDKYVRIRVGRYSESIKRGYVYIRPGRCGAVPCVSERRIKKLPRTK